MLSSIPDRRLVCRLQTEESNTCEIPAGTQIIGDYAFDNCEALKSVTIPEGVSVIGDRAFSGCSVLTAPCFPQSLISVGNYVFSGCMSLGSIRFQEGLISVGDGAFSYCWNQQSIDLPDTLTHLGRDTDGQWKLEGWIRSDDLLFPEKADMDHPTRLVFFLFPAEHQAVTLVTPLGNKTVDGFNEKKDTWLVIGEKNIDGREYWLFYECETEQVGFVLKEEMLEPTG